MRAKIAKWGNSLGLRIPKAVAEEADLKEGLVVEVTATANGLNLRRSTPTASYTIEELVAEMRRLGPEGEPPLIDWGPDVGAEIIDDDYSRGLIREPEAPTHGRKSSRGR